jgi:hypothetical protein
MYVKKHVHKTGLPRSKRLRMALELAATEAFAARAELSAYRRSADSHRPHHRKKHYALNVSEERAFDSVRFLCDRLCETLRFGVEG